MDAEIFVILPAPPCYRPLFFSIRSFDLNNEGSGSKRLLLLGFKTFYARTFSRFGISTHFFTDFSSSQTNKRRNLRNFTQEKVGKKRGTFVHVLPVGATKIKAFIVWEGEEKIVSLTKPKEPFHSFEKAGTLKYKLTS